MTKKIILAGVFAMLHSPVYGMDRGSNGENDPTPPFNVRKTTSRTETTKLATNPINESLLNISGGTARTNRSNISRVSRLSKQDKRLALGQKLDTLLQATDEGLNAHQEWLNSLLNGANDSDDEELNESRFSEQDSREEERAIAELQQELKEVQEESEEKIREAEIEAARRVAEIEQKAAKKIREAEEAHKVDEREKAILIEELEALRREVAAQKQAQQDELARIRVEEEEKIRIAKDNETFLADKGNVAALEEKLEDAVVEIRQLNASIEEIDVELGNLSRDQEETSVGSPEKASPEKILTPEEELDELQAKLSTKLDELRELRRSLLNAPETKTPHIFKRSNETTESALIRLRAEYTKIIEAYIQDSKTLRDQLEAERKKLEAIREKKKKGCAIS